MEKRIPKKRFKEFVGAGQWEEKRLGEVGITFNGLSGKSKKDFGHGQAEFITYLNVFHNTISDIYGTDNVEIDDRQNQVKYGDIFFTTSSETPEEVGMSSVWIDNRPNVYLNSFCFGYRLLESINIYYIAYLLRSPSIRKEFQLLAQGISRYNISKTKAMDINIPIPSLAEQEKIGDFFQKLDKLIDINKDKLAKLKASKSAYLTEMFPAEGEDQPKRRFHGFTEPWQEKKLGEVVEYIKGYPFKSSDYINKGIRIIRVSDLTRNEISFSKDTVYIDSILGEIYKKYSLMKDDIIITTVGSKTELKESAVGRAILVREDNIGLLNQNLVKVVALEGYNSFFIYCQLLQQRYTEYISKIERGNANQANIAIKQLWNYEFSTPSLAEQEKIGNFFQKLDEQISLQEEKIEKLEKMKKAYLAEMFV